MKQWQKLIYVCQWQKFVSEVTYKHGRSWSLLLPYMRSVLYQSVKGSMEAWGNVNRHFSPTQFFKRLSIQNQQESTFILKPTQKISTFRKKLTTDRSIENIQLNNKKILDIWYVWDFLFNEHFSSVIPQWVWG